MRFGALIELEGHGCKSMAFTVLGPWQISVAFFMEGVLDDSL